MELFTQDMKDSVRMMAKRSVSMTCTDLALALGIRRDGSLERASL